MIPLIYILSILLITFLSILITRRMDRAAMIIINYIELTTSNDLEMISGTNKRIKDEDKDIKRLTIITSIILIVNVILVIVQYG